MPLDLHLYRLIKGIIHMNNIDKFDKKLSLANTDISSHKAMINNLKI